MTARHAFGSALAGVAATSREHEEQGGRAGGGKSSGTGLHGPPQDVLIKAPL
jgi:hypothetical protein